MMRIPRKSIAGVIVVGAIAIAAACGGGDDNGDSGDDSITLAEYIAQADAICARYDEQFAAVAVPTNPDELRDFLARTLELGEAQTEELRALPVPPEIADLEAQARANNDEAAELVSEAIERIDDGEDPLTVANDISERGGNIDEENAEIAEEIGLAVCGVDEDGDDDGTTTTTATAPDDTLGDPGTQPTNTTASAAGQYLLDVSAASSALNQIGAIFTGADSPAELQAQAGAVQASVDEFEAAMDSMASYTLDDPQLEEQRSGYVAAGEQLSGPLADLSEAVADGDLGAVAATVPALREAAQEFERVSGQTP